MTRQRLTALFILLIAASSAAFAARPVKPDSTGLSPGSVFGVPKQEAYADHGTMPGENPLLPRAYPGAPPQIPHLIGDFLPITTDTNMCISCHNRPENWGKKRETGTPTPIPQSHYTDLRSASAKVGDHVVGARYTCNQCHVPQHDAKPLVPNTFGAKRR